MLLCECPLGFFIQTKSQCVRAGESVLCTLTVLTHICTKRLVQNAMNTECEGLWLTMGVPRLAHSY